MRIVRDGALAEELTQESFIKAFRALGSYDPRRKLSSWLFKIAHNTSIDYLRRGRLTTESLDVANDEHRSLIETLSDDRVRSPERDAASSDLAVALDRAVAQLRPDYREVLVLRFAQDLSYQEIAEIMELPLGTVKTNIHRARKEMAVLLRAAGWGTEEEKEA